MSRITFALAALALGLGADPARPQASPQGDKEVKLTGTLVCAKCKLKMEGVSKCTNALQVKDGEQTLTYILVDKGMAEDYHECGGGEKKDVTVVGKVTEKDGKKTVKPAKVDVKN
jgi:hypothetical protein